MEHLTQIIWFSIWPILIILAVKFIQLNVKQFNRLERLQRYEEKYGDIDDYDEVNA